MQIPAVMSVRDCMAALKNGDRVRWMARTGRFISCRAARKTTPNSQDSGIRRGRRLEGKKLGISK
jgi:hypothetical protein